MAKRVLIAEDDAAILEVLNNILEGEGYQTFAPKTERKIYEIIRTDPPSLILLDIWLSGQDGAKIAKSLKSNEQTKNIPLIMMSANNETEKISEKVGANGFLLKPFTIDELLAVLRQYT